MTIILIISKGKLIAEGSPDELEELTHGKETIELTILADETSVKQVLSDFSVLMMSTGLM